MISECCHCQKRRVIRRTGLCIACDKNERAEQAKQQAAWMQAHAEGRLTPEQRDDLADLFDTGTSDGGESFVVWEPRGEEAQNA